MQGDFPASFRQPRAAGELLARKASTPPPGTDPRGPSPDETVDLVLHLHDSPQHSLQPADRGAALICARPSPTKEDQSMRIPCPACSTVIKATEQHVGVKNRCVQCGTKFIIPASEEEEIEIIERGEDPGPIKPGVTKVQLVKPASEGLVLPNPKTPQAPNTPKTPLLPRKPITKEDPASRGRLALRWTMATGPKLSRCAACKPSRQALRANSCTSKSPPRKRSGAWVCSRTPELHAIQSLLGKGARPSAPPILESIGVSTVLPNLAGC
jgi:predicted Zn finger-like uncharacterized protein